MKVASHQQLAGRVAIVTGGAGSLGRAISSQLAADGCRVVIGDRDLRAARDVQTKIKQSGGDALGVDTDVTCSDSLQRLIDGAYAPEASWGAQRVAGFHQQLPKVTQIAAEDRLLPPLGRRLI